MFIEKDKAIIKEEKGKIKREIYNRNSSKLRYKLVASSKS
jgi:hypothetical protein